MLFNQQCFIQGSFPFLSLLLFPCPILPRTFNASDKAFTSKRNSWWGVGVGVVVVVAVFQYPTFWVQYQILLFYIISKLRLRCNTFIESHVTCLHGNYVIFLLISKGDDNDFILQFLSEKQVFIDLMGYFIKPMNWISPN